MLRLIWRIGSYIAREKRPKKSPALMLSKARANQTRGVNERLQHTALSTRCSTELIKIDLKLKTMNCQNRRFIIAWLIGAFFKHHSCRTNSVIFIQVAVSSGRPSNTRKNFNEKPFKHQMERCAIYESEMRLMQIGTACTLGQRT
jgi:hypothetical protein